jgi:ribosomal protein L30/L7E
MSAQPPERKVAKFLGVFSFGLGLVSLASPERVTKLIGVKDTPKTRGIIRAVGVQELTAAQGIFAFSPPTPVLWTRVAGDAVHLTLLGRAYSARRSDKTKLGRTIAAIAGITAVDALVSARYQKAWPKEPTQGEPIKPTERKEEPELEASVPGNPAITILASEDEIRPRLQEFDIEAFGTVSFKPAPGDRGTEVHVEMTKKSNPLKKVVGSDPEQQVQDRLRKVKQLIEVGEIVVSEAAPDGISAKRQLKQRAAQPLSEKELEKVGGAA